MRSGFPDDQVLAIQFNIVGVDLADRCQVILDAMFECPGTLDVRTENRLQPRKRDADGLAHIECAVGQPGIKIHAPRASVSAGRGARC